MQYSGYSKKFRHEVVNAALTAYDEIQGKANDGERPLYRLYDWNLEERNKAKNNYMNDWCGRGGYRSVIFVPSTPGSVLPKRYQSDVDRQGLQMTVFEKAGRSIKSMIQRLDPFPIQKCDQQSCMVCQTFGKGLCNKEGVTFSIHCAQCQREVWKKSITKNHPGMLTHRERSIWMNILGRVETLYVGS